MSLSVLTDHPVHRSIYDAVGIPMKAGGHGLSIEAGPLRIRIDVASVFRPDGEHGFVRSLHQLGSPFVDLRSFVSTTQISPLSPVYGPGTSQPFLRMSAFSGLGRTIHRDDPQIRSNYARISSGDLTAPLGWIRPGFPAVVHLSDWWIDGGKVRGALASSVDRPGGFVILEPRDLVRLMGYEPPPEFSESDLPGLVPFEALGRILDWVEAETRSIAFSSGSTPRRIATH